MPRWQSAEENTHGEEDAANRAWVIRMKLCSTRLNDFVKRKRCGISVAKQPQPRAMSAAPASSGQTAPKRASESGRPSVTIVGMRDASDGRAF